VVEQGSKVLVKGDSGSGKSTLIRAIAGLWPWGSGRILRPKGAKVAFMPQRPYVPLGTLRHALLYPEPDRAATRRYAERFSWDDTTNSQLLLFGQVLQQRSRNCYA